MTATEVTATMIKASRNTEIPELLPFFRPSGTAFIVPFSENFSVMKYIEDFFEVNTKYTSSNVLKISIISGVHSTQECVAGVKSLIFSTHLMKYLWYLPKVNFIFIFSVKGKNITFFLAFLINFA